MTMTAEQLAQLREVAERAKDNFMPNFMVSTRDLLALLDELERVTAERNALREGEMGDARHSNTRAAADIYFQLVEECEIPPGGSLVEHIDSMRERIAELEGRTVTVKLPESVIDAICLTAAEIHNLGRGVSDERAQEIINSIRCAAGINLTVEG